METLFTYAKRPVAALPEVQGFMHEVVEDLNRETVSQLLGILTVLVSLCSLPHAPLRAAMSISVLTRRLLVSCLSYSHYYP